MKKEYAFLGAAILMTAFGAYALAADGRHADDANEVAFVAKVQEKAKSVEPVYLPDSDPRSKIPVDLLQQLEMKQLPQDA